MTAQHFERSHDRASRPVGRRPVRDALAAFLADPRGAAAAEFAVVMPLLVLLVFGVVTFASALFVHSNMLNAARESARQVSVTDAASHTPGGAIHCLQAEAQIPGSAEKVACDYLNTWGTNFLIDVTDRCPAERIVDVNIRTDAANAALLDIFGFFNGRTLEADVSMRREAQCPPIGGGGSGG